MMMAKYPVMMASWSGALPTVVDTVWRALADALPERIPAAHSGSLGATFVFFGYDPRRDRRFVVQSIESGGWGGRPNEDGESVSMSVCQGDVRNAPIENIELKNPILVLERSLRQDSGGPGKFRGGLGINTRARALVAGRWAAGGGGGRVNCPPWGLWGGKSGKIAETLIKGPADTEFRRSESPRYNGDAGSEILHRTAGGGGWGDPLERDPASVLVDVREGYISAQAALDEYGVVLSSDCSAVDVDATARLRADRSILARG
jgi:N-methylhydantoinase B